VSYWLRELGGWALVLFGLVQFVLAYDLLLSKRVIQAGPMVFIGFIVFRGGIHLLKVAAAARAARALPEVHAQAGRRPSMPSARPVGPTPPGQVLPGPKAAAARPAR
jgi:hypothetical protein